MKTLDDLREFYDGTLSGQLADLEQERKKIAQKLIITFIVLGCISAAVCLLFIGKVHDIVPFIFIPIVLCVIVGVFIYKYQIKSYVSGFKLLIIEKIVHFIDENLNYNEYRGITKSEFMLSQIFKTKPNRYKSDDLVWGKAGDTQIKFSEINAEYESGSGKNRSVRTVFKGLFFTGDFNKHFTGQTVVLPDTSERLLGWLGQKLQEWNISRAELVKLEDAEFERHFVVYSNDQIEARYILSTSLMKRIVDFKEKTNRKIHLSFIGSQIFVAVSYTKDLFEPRIFRTLLDFEPIAEYFEDLQLAIGIVEDLNLNTRIWSKE